MALLLQLLSAGIESVATGWDVKADAFKHKMTLCTVTMGSYRGHVQQMHLSLRRCSCEAKPVHT